MSMNPQELQLAQRVQQACIEAAKKGFQEALISGLCSEGAMEVAISQIQMLNLELIITKSDD